MPKEPNFVGSGLPHVGPWDYIQTVPMLWYGPGFVKAQGEVDRPVTVAGIAPTAAQLLKFDGFRAPDGQPMTEALLPEAQREMPKLFVTMVWDAGGINVLEEHPERLAVHEVADPEGHLVHRRHRGIVADEHRADPRHDRHGRVPDCTTASSGTTCSSRGTITGPWNQGPSFLVEPTFADIYDRALDNEPVVGIVGTVDIHFGMLGHGSFFSGGDRGHRAHPLGDRRRDAHRRGLRMEPAGA